MCFIKNIIGITRKKLKFKVQIKKKLVAEKFEEIIKKLGKLSLF